MAGEDTDKAARVSQQHAQVGVGAIARAAMNFILHENSIKRIWYVVEARKETRRGAEQRRKKSGICTLRHRPSCLQLRSVVNS